MTRVHQTFFPIGCPFWDCYYNSVVFSTPPGKVRSEIRRNNDVIFRQQRGRWKNCLLTYDIPDNANICSMKYNFRISSGKQNRNAFHYTVKLPYVRTCCVGTIIHVYVYIQYKYNIDTYCIEYCCFRTCTPDPHFSQSVLGEICMRNIFFIIGILEVYSFSYSYTVNKVFWQPWHSRHRLHLFPHAHTRTTRNFSPITDKWIALMWFVS